MKITVPGANTATFQQMSVQNHTHTYEDRGAAAKTVSTGGLSTTTVADDKTELYETKDTLKYSDGTNFPVGETRPNTLVMNFIIKI